MQSEAAWSRTSQQAFSVYFAETSADHSSKHHAALAAVSHKWEQHTTTSPHGSKPYLCSYLLRSDSNSHIVSSSVTTLNLTPMLSLLISHAKEKHKRSTHNVPNLPLYNPSDWEQASLDVHVLYSGLFFQKGHLGTELSLSSPPISPTLQLCSPKYRCPVVQQACPDLVQDLHTKGTAVEQSPVWGLQEDTIHQLEFYAHHFLTPEQQGVYQTPDTAATLLY